jgi:tetratricopeptide (TPR) repeat protein
MPEEELDETQPEKVQEKKPGNRRKKFPGWLAAIIVVLLIAIGALGGYESGMGKRYSAQDTQVTGQLEQQFQLGQEAVQAKQYQVAMQHFDYIIQNNPDFPGVREAYADLLVRMQITPTATPTLTPTMTPTPDTRSVDQIYANVTALLSQPGDDLCARNWDEVIGMLDSLRKADINYHTADVDGMYFIALRSRGVCKIYPQQYEPNASCSDLNINLEGGIYDLTLAENFGTLDSNATALRTAARMYITGASFWDQDWPQVLNYFSQLRNIMPYMADSTCTSATERWRLANIDYAQYLINQGAYCKAKDQILEAFTVNTPKNAEIYPTATAVRDYCAFGGPGAQAPAP